MNVRSSVNICRSDVQVRTQMDRITQLKKSEELVEAVLKDKSFVDQALEQWPEAVADADHKVLENARWHLVYISNDDDIIQREPAYEEKMMQPLQEIKDDLSARIDSAERDDANRGG